MTPRSKAPLLRKMKQSGNALVAKVTKASFALPAGRLHRGQRQKAGAVPAEKKMDGNFCTACGSKRPEELICQHCGTAAAAGAKFCAQCGKPLTQETE